MGFFEVSHGAARRARIRAKLPTVYPVALDVVDAAVGDLPDPEVLCAEERAGAMAKVALINNRVQAYLTRVAAVSDERGDSRVLGAGTTGTLVAAATGSTVQAGSAVVATGRELRGFPELSEAFDAGRVSAQHVSVVLQTTQGLKQRGQVVAAAVVLAAATDPRETRHVLQVVADAEGGEHGQLSHAEQRARRGVRLSARASGMWRLSGLLDDVEGARLAEVLGQFSAARDAGVDAGESLPQRRADALARGGGRGGGEPDAVGHVGVVGADRCGGPAGGRAGGVGRWCPDHRRYVRCAGVHDGVCGDLRYEDPWRVRAVDVGSHEAACQQCAVGGVDRP